jgi:hypothetical protein
MRRGVERRYDYSMKRIVCTALLGLLASILPAQTSSNLQNSAVWKPPRILKSDALPKGTVSRLMVRALRISDLNVKLEETNMNQVQQRFGGTFGVQGDAGDSLEWLCLSGRDAGGRFVLWLKSGEMDAGTVGSFQWRRVPKQARFDARCATLSEADQVKLTIPLHPGMSESQLFEALGKPTVRHDNTLLYVHEHDEGSKNGPFTVLNTVSIVLRDGAVWAIEVLKVSVS